MALGKQRAGQRESRLRGVVADHRSEGERPPCRAFSAYGFLSERLRDVSRATTSVIAHAR